MRRLETLPPEVCSLGRLQRLDLSGNALTALPAGVSQLTSLRGLVVRQNRLAALPAELAACGALQELDARQNSLAELPGAFSGLRQLRSLLLDDNRRGASSHRTLLVRMPGRASEQARQAAGAPDSKRQLRSLLPGEDRHAPALRCTRPRTPSSVLLKGVLRKPNQARRRAGRPAGTLGAAAMPTSAP